MRSRFPLVFCLTAVLAGAVLAQSTEQLMSFGADQLRSGDYSQAVGSFKKAVTRDPGNFEAQFNLALAYLAWGHDQEALNEFKKASNLDQRNSDVWANMGVAYERLGNKGKATESLSKAISLNPSNIDARINLASMYADLGRSGDALTQFKQVLSVDGRNIVALINVARILAAKKSTTEAKKYLNDALAVDPGNAEVHWELGNVLWKEEKKPADAVVEYRKAVSFEPTSQVFYDELGQALEAEGKKDEALDVYRTYLAYLSDAIKKEEIEKRIDRIEHPSGSAAQEAEAPRRSTRGTPAEAPHEDRMQVDQSSTSDIMGDLNDLTKDDGKKLDLKEEAKKKSQSKK